MSNSAPMNWCSLRPAWELFTNTGREWTLEHSGGGPWLPLRVGHTYHARAVASSDGFTNVPPGMMLMSLGSALVASLPNLTNGTPVTITVATKPDLTGVQTGLGTGPMLV